MAFRQLRGLTMAALAASLAVHGALGAVIVQAPKSSAEAKPQQVVELAVIEPPPPPPPAPAPAPEPEPPPPPKPQVLRPLKSKTLPVPAPPPPSVLPPVPLPEAEPVAGVSPDTVAENSLADVVVPLGNHLSAAVVASDKSATPQGFAGGVASGTGVSPFAPVAEGFVKQWPRTLDEVRAPYPEEARRMDISGTVRLRVGIDETGRVREVKVVKRAGYGLDEAAAKAMWRFKFSPAVGHNGRPVAFRINYDYTFTPGR